VRSLLVLLAAASLAPAQLAPLPDAHEDYARALVAHPALSRGEVDVAVHDWLDRLEDDPGHPLAAAVLTRVGMVRGLLLDPARADGRLLALRPDERWTPAARRELERIAGRVRVVREPVEALEQDLFPTYLRRFWVLAPLGPDRPLAWIDGAPAFVGRMRRPRFDAVHEGLDGPVRWRPLERPNGWPGVTPGRGLASGDGWALVASAFHTPRGGPGYLEIEVLDFRADPSFAFSLNGEDPVAVDYVGAQRGRTTTHRVALRRGTNRLVLLSSLASGAAYAVRVLGRDGAPWAGLVELEPAEVGGPSPPSLVNPPPSPPPGPLRHLREYRPGPDALALRALLMLDAGRSAQALAALGKAVTAAPDRPLLASLLVRVTDEARHLPEGTRRQRARELAERVLAERPRDVPTGLWSARLEVEEDEPIAALERLEALSRARPRQVRSRLERHALLASLGFELEAEAALTEAVHVAPDSPSVLWRAAEAADHRGRRADALAFARRAVEAGGRTPAGLRRLAEHELQLGHLDRAEAALREAWRRDPARDPSALVELLEDAGRIDEAAALLAPLTERIPDWDDPERRLARLAARRGDVAAETRHWRRVAELVPSDPVARARLADLTGEDPVARLIEHVSLDRDAVLEDFDPSSWPGESIVRVLDHAVVVVFEDGVTETITHDVWHVRDHDAVETIGTRRLPGEVLEAATIKGPGSERPGAVLRPVRVDGAYQMPQLEPGDFVETKFRLREAPGSDGIARPGRWTFANERMPFDVSHWVVAIPDGQPVEIVEHEFEGLHETTRRRDWTVHTWRAEGMARVPQEAKAPPRGWYLPWVELGHDEDLTTVAAALRRQMLAATVVTPELREVASQLSWGMADDLQRARRAYEFVNEHLDSREGTAHATHALLERKGNPATLFSALLRALDVEHEIVWSRDVSPEADGEPDPAFIHGAWFARKPYVIVRPARGPVVWCDFSSRELPFGTTTGGAPRAPVLVPSSGRIVREPDGGESRPSTLIDVALAVEPDGSARVSARVRFVGSLGFVLKEPIRQVPSTQRPLYATLLASEALPGMTVTSLALPGLDEPREPVGVELSGEVERFLDEDGTCRLPLRPLAMTERYPVEGRRRLPLLEPSPLVDRTLARLEPDEGLRLERVPESVLLEFREGLYALAFEPLEDGGLAVKRHMMMPPFSLEAAEFDEFLAFCRRIDDAERTRLRFVPAD